ncbi:MAG TPA: DUF302 domain-containing protein [Fimbriimonadaceae bacterium]|nr:DUF302 domain-containing protein [Fimbriimonadaceae bacterium]
MNTLSVRRLVLFSAATLAVVAVALAQKSPQAPAQAKMPAMEIVVESKYGFEETVEKVKQAAEAEKYPVQGVHEISAILESKGFPREPLTVVEVCNAKSASASLENDIRVALMMPCPIAVYREDGKIKVMTFNTRQMAMMYKGATMAQVGAEVDVALRKILFAVAK